MFYVCHLGLMLVNLFARYYFDPLTNQHYGINTQFNKYLKLPDKSGELISKHKILWVLKLSFLLLTIA